MSLDPGSRFPSLPLQDLAGHPVDPVKLLGDVPLSLVGFGHQDCDTTRLTLPYLDRMHRLGARVLAILQDDAAGAAALQERIGAFAMPVLLDPSPYRFGAEIQAKVVPILWLLGSGLVVEAGSEGFRRADLESFAARLGLGAPFFKPGEKAPALRPG